MPNLKKTAKRAAKGVARGAAKIARDPAVQAAVKGLAKQAAKQVKQQARRQAGPAVSKLLGLGDYYMKGSRNIHAGNLPSSALRVSNSTVYEREEFVGSIISNHTSLKTTFNKFRVNPGNYAVFNAGSQIALQYQSYVPLGCEFVYKSTSANALNSTNTALGKVCLAAQYNSFARDWDSFVELENASDSVTVNPSENAILGVECNPAKRGSRTLYVSATDPGTAGKPFYDLGDVFVATTGVQGIDVPLGDLFVRYKWRLFDPIVRDTTFPNLTIFATGSNASANDTLATAPTVTEDVTTKTGATLTWAANSLTIAGLRPLVGRARVTVQLNKFGSNGARTGPTCAFTGTYRGVPVTPTADTLDINSQSPANAGSVGNAVFTATQLYPVDTDTIIITFTPGVGVAGDTFRALFTISPGETSDF